MPRIWLPLTVLLAVGIAFMLFLAPPPLAIEENAMASSSIDQALAPAQPLSLKVHDGIINRKESEQGSFLENAMEEFGLVEVLVVDDLGQAIQGVFRVELQVLHPPDPEGGKHKTNYWSVHYQELQNGRCLFQKVGFERNLKILVSTADRSLDHSFESICPTREAGRTTLRVEFYQGRCLLTGRLVDRNGRALSNQSFSCSLKYHPTPRWNSSNRTLHTDSLGNFVLALDSGFTTDESVVLKIRQPPTRNRPPVSFQTRLISFFGERRKDLGTIALKDEAVAVAGVVIDENRIPIAHADVFLMPIVPLSEGFDPFLEDEEDQILSTTTNQEGVFQFFGDANAIRHYSLTAEQQGFLFLEEEEIGADYHVLKMQRWIEVRGRLLLDPGIHRDNLEIVLIRPDGSETIAWNDIQEKDETLFRFPRQTPGDQINLLVRSALLKEELYTDFNLVFSLDDQHLDLGTIDLRGLLNPVSISVMDELGRALDSTWAWKEPMEEKAYFKQPLQLIRGEEVIQLVIGTDDRPYGVLGDQRTDLDLVLPRGIPVEIVVSPMPDFEEGWYFYGGLHDLRETENLWLPFLSDDPPVYRLEVPGPGTYQVEFQLSHWSEEHGWGQAFSILPRAGLPSIQIENGSLAQSFSVSWSQAEAVLLQQRMLALEADQ